VVRLSLGCSCSHSSVFSGCSFPVTEMPVEEALSLKVNHGAADVVISNLEGGSCLVAYAFYSGVPEEGSLGGQPCPVGYWGMRGLLVVLAVLVYGFIRVLVEFFG